ncbi:hypothetical protein AB205_0052580 [Aquarana catesbeiana]|uniref:Uncharacterized protein n=1 Tax=Aquarana catesbeiana TaxID=8400 RepID=A0A2G9P518_AQUCT|nr:hypothetical protein AB205_0052580 [Aquarana catesbeiana]
MLVGRFQSRHVARGTLGAYPTTIMTLDFHIRLSRTDLANYQCTLSIQRPVMIAWSFIDPYEVSSQYPYCSCCLFFIPRDIRTVTSCYKYHTLLLSGRPLLVGVHTPASWEFLQLVQVPQFPPPTIDRDPDLAILASPAESSHFPSFLVVLSVISSPVQMLKGQR